MTIFCNQCGTKNEGDAGFCMNCGVPLRKTSAPKPAPSPATGLQHGGANWPSMTIGSKKAWFSGAALATLVLLACAAAYYALKAPEATASHLLAAAQEGNGPAFSAQYKRQLCLSNINYSQATVNVAEHNRNAQTWLNALVSAGLYSAAVPINEGGYFSQNLMQYVATPELAKWRVESRLCVAKNVAIAEVIDIEKPTEQTLGRSAQSRETKVRLVKAMLLLQSTETAPWLKTPEVQALIMEKLAGWEYKNGSVQKQVPELFVLRKGQWTNNPSYKAELQELALASADDSDNSDNSVQSSDPDENGFLASLGQRISGFFSSGAHPLQGKWRLDSNVGKSFGMGLPAGIGLDITMEFTANSMKVGGETIKCKFEVDEKKVKVTPDGQVVSINFVLQDKDTASVDMGLFKVQYKRVH